MSQPESSCYNLCFMIREFFTTAVSPDAIGQLDSSHTSKNSSLITAIVNMMPLRPESFTQYILHAVDKAWSLFCINRFYLSFHERPELLQESQMLQTAILIYYSSPHY